MQIDQSRKEEIIHEMRKKDHLDFEEDFTTMAVFTFLKEN